MTTINDWNPTMTTNQLFDLRIIRNAVRGEKRSIQIGRSRHVAGAGSGTPIVIMPDCDDAPKLSGRPYLKTGFNNGRGFSTTLYTPSTLQIVVGANWNPYDRE